MTQLFERYFSSIGSFIDLGQHMFYTDPIYDKTATVSNMAQGATIIFIHNSTCVESSDDKSARCIPRFGSFSHLYRLSSGMH